MIHTVWAHFEYCNGLFGTKLEAEQHANDLAKEYFGMTDKEVEAYTSDDWTDERDNCNILPIELNLAITAKTLYTLFNSANYDNKTLEEVNRIKHVIATELDIVEDVIRRREMLNG